MSRSPSRRTSRPGLRGAGLPVSILALGLALLWPGPAPAQGVVPTLRLAPRPAAAIVDPVPDAPVRPPSARASGGTPRDMDDPPPGAEAPPPRPPRRGSRPADDVAEALVAACAGGSFFGLVSAATALTAVAATGGPMAASASTFLMALPVMTTAAISAGALGCGLAVASAMFSSAAVELFRRSREIELPLP